MRFVAGRGAAGGWSEAEVCAEELADPRMPVWHHREKVATPRQDIRLRGGAKGNGNSKSFSCLALACYLSFGLRIVE